MSGVEIDSLLKAQESQLQSIIDGVNKQNDERIPIHYRNLTDEVSKICDVSKERHELFAKQLMETKVVCRLKFLIFESCWNLKFNFFYESPSMLYNKIDVVAEASTLLIEDITSLKKDYTFGLQDKMK